MYFHYDPAVGLRGNYPSIDQGPGRPISVRKARQGLNWKNPNFVEAIIDRSRGHVDEVKDQALPMIMPRESEDRSSASESDRDEPSNPRRAAILYDSGRDSDSGRDEPTKPVPVSIPDESVWQIINHLRWVDQDEIERSPEYVANALSPDERFTLYNGGLGLAQRLSLVFESTPAYIALDDISKKNVMFHIIGKGQDFYKFVLECPDVAMYIFDNKWQPLYTWLRQLQGQR